MLVARELAAECKRKGITQKEVARAAGFGAEQFSYYLRGSRGSITVAMVIRAAEHLGARPEEIIERAYAAMPPLAVPAPIVEVMDAVVILEDAPRPQRAPGRRSAGSSRPAPPSE